MKPEIPTNIEKLRVTKGPLRSTAKEGRNGHFMIPYGNRTLAVIISDGRGWDHVSVSLKHRTPTWEEMCFIKNLFFRKDETVIQYHPREDQYKNVCRTCLHMWRKQGEEAELPPGWMIA